MFDERHQTGACIPCTFINFNLAAKMNNSSRWQFMCWSTVILKYCSCCAESCRQLTSINWPAVIWNLCKTKSSTDEIHPPTRTKQHDALVVLLPTSLIKTRSNWWYALKYFLQQVPQHTQNEGSNFYSFCAAYCVRFESCPFANLTRNLQHFQLDLMTSDCSSTGWKYPKSCNCKLSSIVNECSHKFMAT